MDFGRAPAKSIRKSIGAVEEKFDFLRPKGAKKRIFRVNREMREKNRVYNPILDEF